MKYFVDDIFYSIQGEGYHTGKAAIFIRLFGCDRACSFCDTPQIVNANASIEYTVGDIMEEVMDLGKAAMVVITGGEPTLQQLPALIYQLHREGYYVSVETNGYDLDQFPRYQGWFDRIFSKAYDPDWITFSPKGHLFQSVIVDEVKLLFGGRCEPYEVNAYVKAKVKYIQPMCVDGKFVQIDNIIDFIKHNPMWRLSLQTHKMIGIK